MGRAQIVSDDGDGKYTIKVLHDTTAAMGMLAAYVKALSATDARIADETDADALARLKARKAALEKSIERMSVITDDLDYQTTVWCADYSEGLSGFVGTIEPAADVQEGINIRPGYTDFAFHDAARDGQLTPFVTLPVADAILNFALYPAIQKWKPTYRYGTISNIDYDAHTCSVSLDSVTSRIQDLDVNHTSEFDDVPIEYMNCHSAAFEDGDSVIVQFDPTDAISCQPKVIGFKESPKPCGIAIKILSINGETNFSKWGVMLTQPIGTGPEYDILSGPTALDAAHTAEMEIIDGKQVDQDKPLHVWLCDMEPVTLERRSLYFNEDSSSTPQWGVRLVTDTVSPFDKNYFWTYQPTNLSEQDFLLKQCPGHRHTSNLLIQAKTNFTSADGQNLNGYEIAFDGVLGIHWQWTRFSTIDIPDLNTSIYPITRYDGNFGGWTVYVEGIQANFDYGTNQAIDFPRFVLSEIYFGSTITSGYVDYLGCDVPVDYLKMYWVYDINAYAGEVNPGHNVTHTRTINGPVIMATIDGLPLRSDGDDLTHYQMDEDMTFWCKNIIVNSYAACGRMAGYYNGDEYPDEPWCDGADNYTKCPWELVSQATMVYEARALNADRM